MLHNSLINSYRFVLHALFIKTLTVSSEAGSTNNKKVKDVNRQEIQVVEIVA